MLQSILYTLQARRLVEASVSDGLAANKLKVLLEQRDALKERQNSLRHQLVCTTDDHCVHNMLVGEAVFSLTCVSLFLFVCYLICLLSRFWENG